MANISDASNSVTSDPSISNLFGVPSPPPPAPTAAPTLSTSPTLSSAPAPGQPLTLDLTGKLNSHIAVAGAEIDYVEMISNATVSALTDATATTIITSNSKVYDGSPIWIKFSTPVLLVPSNAGGNFCIIDLYEDGSGIGRMAMVGSTTGGAPELREPLNIARRHTPTPGPHTYSIRAWRANADCTIVGLGGGAGVELAAYLSITRV